MTQAIRKLPLSLTRFAALGISEMMNVLCPTELRNRLDATSVRHILKQRVGDGPYSPHSLRSGFITSAAKASVPEHVIQRTSRHKSADVLRGYIRDGDGFANCAGRHL